MTQTPTAPVHVLNRVLAKMLDILIVFALAGVLPYPLGPLAGFIYSLVADGIQIGKFQGQSVGKKLLGLQVVQLVAPATGLATGAALELQGSGGFAESDAPEARMKTPRERKPMSLRASVVRNAPVGVATFFAIIPVWGWLILALVGVPLMVMEIYLMVTAENGHRLGDVMADTEVVRAETSGHPKLPQSTSKPA